MNDSRIWIHPITMTAITPPQMKIVDNCVYELVDGGMALARCMPTGSTLLLPDICDGKPILAIGPGAVSNAVSLLQAFLPRSIVSIGDYAFYQCSCLTEVRIKPNLQSIGDYAFAGCKNLRRIYIPPTVKTIGKDAFLGADKLIIQGEENSPIHRYAKEHNLRFSIVCGPNAA